MQEEKINKKEERERRIKKELKKLKKLYENNSKNTLKQIEELHYKAYFLLILSQDMEFELSSCEKFMVEVVNGSQFFKKANPLIKEYRETVKSYQAVLKQLDEFTKDKPLEPLKPDPLEEFVDS